MKKIIIQFVWMWLIINVLIVRTDTRPILPQLIGGVASLAAGLLGGFGSAFGPPQRQAFFQAPGIQPISTPFPAISPIPGFTPPAPPPGFGAQLGPQFQLPIYGVQFPPPTFAVAPPPVQNQ